MLRELRDQQVRFAPREKKIEQLERAERLLREVDSGKTYSYEYVCFRVTGYRPETAPIVPIAGVTLQNDLSNLIEDLSESANIRADELGPTGPYRGAIQQDVQRVHQDDFPLASAGAGQPQDHF